ERVLPLPLDVTRESDAILAVEAAIARFGRIDVLVNNAGYGLLGAFEEIEPAEIEQQFATNVFGAFNVLRAVLPVMRRQQSGHVFSISSVGGIVGFAGGSVYCASKFALEGLSESLAAELADFGVRMTIVEPGFIRTDFLDSSSVRYGTRAVEGYGEHSAAMRRVYEEKNHAQDGDAAKLAVALVQLADAKQPPLRWAAGSDAVAFIAGKLETARGELEQWRALSVSTDRSA
ncbi:MAG: SDR family NAD(P)-dependent oxidoreductase, partial [Deltaproteobacteria bacterium]|nr:SDR family NAD(P)-dependent oxidoreductase [Nannocystaceae bacterium]